MTDLRPSRLKSLLTLLEQDRDNSSLIADAATTAFEEGDLPAASGLLDRYAATTPLTPPLKNLAALIALRTGRVDEAGEIFEELLRGAPGDFALRFNLAWCKALERRWEECVDLLDAEVAAQAPHAAALRVQALHHLGQLEEALAWGAEVAERQPNNAGLLSAMSVAAVDAEDLELARTYATRAGETPEALATLGMLSLDTYESDEAHGLFDRALALRADNARALLGKGLVLLSDGQPRAAGGFIDKGAETFGDHLGSWVAAGWAYFIDGDYVTSRQRFETALAIDDTFAEIHGGLAVLDVVAGQIDSARERTRRAFRLDRACFSAALAQSLLLERDGDPAAAGKVRETALNTPIGDSGSTIAQAIVGLATNRRGPPH